MTSYDAGIGHTLTWWLSVKSVIFARSCGFSFMFD
jgi:hypothetical protein